MNNSIIQFGNPESVYMINYMEELKKNNINSMCIDLFKNNNYKKNIFFKKISVFFSALKKMNSFSKKSRNTRIAHIQFVSFYYVLFVYFFKTRFNRLVVTFWGSDLLRQSSLKLWFMFPLFFVASSITFETEQMKNIFLSKLFIFKKSKKLCYTRFGLPELNVIDNTSKDEIDEFNKYCGIDKNLITVVLGYNRRVEQQHLKVLEHFEDLKLNNLIQIVVPWTYGAVERDYEKQLRDRLDALKIKYIFLDKFLSEKEVACLRLTTDYFIQVQTTDSLSACMLESIYANKIVITGNWLPYDFLDELKIAMYKVESPELVGRCLQDLIICSAHKNINKYVINNREKVAKIANWDFCINDWLKLYE